MSQDRLFIWKSNWKQLGWAHTLEGVGSQNHQGRWMALAGLMETQIWCPPAHAGLVGEGSTKEQCFLPPLLSGRKLPLYPSSWSQTIQFLPVYPRVSLAFYELLSPCWSSDQVSLSVSGSVHGPFKRNAWASSSPCSQPQSPLICMPRGYRDLSHWNPGLGSLLGGQDASLLRGASAAETALSVLPSLTWLWDPPVPCLRPCYRSPHGFFSLDILRHRTSV